MALRLPGSRNASDGLGVVAINVQKFRVAARKLKLDLYQRRYEVFQALHVYMTTSGKLPSKSENGFNDKPAEAVDDLEAEARLAAFDTARRKAYEKMAESRFLFDKATCDYITDFVNNISVYHSTNELIQSEDYQDMRAEKKRLADENMTRSMWMLTQYEPMVAAFSPSMKLDHAFGLKFPFPWSRKREARSLGPVSS